MKRALLSAGLGSVLAWLALPGSVALACTCEATPAVAQLERADAVFTGEILSLTPEPSGEQRAEFRVLIVYKGDVAPVVDVRTDRSPLTCGLQFSRDAEYLVFGRIAQSGYTTSLCAGTTDDVDALAGSGIAGKAVTTPSTASIERPLADDPAPRTLPIAAASSVLAGVCLGHVRRVKKMRGRSRSVMRVQVEGR